MNVAKRFIVVLVELLFLYAALIVLARMVLGDVEVRDLVEVDAVAVGQIEIREVLTIEAQELKAFEEAPEEDTQQIKVEENQGSRAPVMTATLEQAEAADEKSHVPTVESTPTPEVAVSTEQVESGSARFENRSGSNWTEISPEVDDRFIANPGIGWQYYWSSPRVNTIPQIVAYGERDSQYWALLNPAEGVYDWTALDAYVDAAAANGEQISFRVYSSSNTHKYPQWVLDAGVGLLPNGDIDHLDCIYQEKWGMFVEALIDKYDGNLNIAYIDISGYGDYNEWGWESQTEWDYLWAENYAAGTASSETMSTLDSYARRRLADMFIGGSYPDHECRNPNGSIQTLSYSYPGFQSSQLVLPYAGIRQSTQYVYLRRQDVGFRHDCMGRESSNGIIDGLRHEIGQIWPKAPVVLETCLPNQFDYEAAKYLFFETHASLAHNAKIAFTDEEILGLIQSAGYKYALLTAGYDSSGQSGGALEISMVWQNIGSAPSYPKMGQAMTLHLYLVGADGTILIDHQLDEDISAWMPGLHSKHAGRGVNVYSELLLPGGISPGNYRLMAAIINTRTGHPINLATTLVEENGLYELGVVSVISP